jgi:iron complex transport system substrate-binding protein
MDDMGREVTISSKPLRIVSLAPSNTEIIFALGTGDRLVGNTEYCNYPEGAVSIEKIGGFSDVNIEKIVSLEPDIVFATSMHEEPVKRLAELGVPSVVFNPVHVEDILADITLMGTVIQEEEKAQALVDDLSNRIEAVKQQAPSSQPTVYVEGWASSSGYGSFGPGSFVDDLLFIAGGLNIGKDTDTSYPTLTGEAIISENPQIIIIVSGMGGVGREDLVGRPGWDTIDAVREGNIYVIDGDLVLRLGPRIVEGLEILAGHIQTHAQTVFFLTVQNTISIHPFVASSMV